MGVAAKLPLGGRDRCGCRSRGPRRCPFYGLRSRKTGRGVGQGRRVPRGGSGAGRRVREEGCPTAGTGADPSERKGYRRRSAPAGEVMFTRRAARRGSPTRAGGSTVGQSRRGRPTGRGSWSTHRRARSRPRSPSLGGGSRRSGRCEPSEGLAMPRLPRAARRCPRRRCLGDRRAAQLAGMGWRGWSAGAAMRPASVSRGLRYRTGARMPPSESTVQSRSMGR